MIRAYPKQESRATARRRKRRIEREVIRAARATVVTRDGYCRLWTATATWHDDGCWGPSEWAHLIPRSLTRGRPPRERHGSDKTLMLCRRHHQALDEHRLTIQCGPRGARERVSFRWAGDVAARWSDK